MYEGCAMCAMFVSVDLCEYFQRQDRSCMCLIASCWGVRMRNNWGELLPSSPASLTSEKYLICHCVT